ncbi:DnaD domain protein [Macrococcoides caseolyticum]|uniref:DnaD domain protein n=1 Tax=Macrococcoides caseolyticum TaxID=69966 RepID=UPI001F3E5B63|nr:DnaD domain protein [Macrococcus caseolyticus]MCE4957049.1 DnaD domain protein [Macrococcus caseolyticus]
MSIFKTDVMIPRLLFEHYHLIGMSETELVLIIKILELSENNSLPSFEIISNAMSIDKSQVMLILQNLISKDFIKIDVKKYDEAHFEERYDLSPLEHRLLQLKHEHKKHAQEHDQKMNFKAVFERFEAAFARPLTPIEIETISHWIDTDHHSATLIIAALNEASSHNKLSIKYIDRILLNWKKRNVKTIEESKIISDQFKTTKTMTKKIPDIPIFDWVNGENPYDK